MAQNNSYISLFLEPLREFLSDDSVSEILVNFGALCERGFFEGSRLKYCKIGGKAA